MSSRFGPPTETSPKNVGQVGQFPYFIGFCAGLNLTNFTRSRLFIGKARYRPIRLVCHFLHFVTFVSFCSKSSLLLYSCFQEIWRQGSIKFDAHHSSHGSQECQSLDSSRMFNPQFLRPFYSPLTNLYSRAVSAPLGFLMTCLLSTFSKRLSRRFAAGGDSFKIRFQVVKDQWSSSGLRLGNPCEPDRNGQKFVEKKVVSRPVSETKTMSRFFYSLHTQNQSLAASARSSQISSSPLNNRRHKSTRVIVCSQ